MRRRDKVKSIDRANILAEQRYLASKGLITEYEEEYDGDDYGKKQDRAKARHLALYNSPIKVKLNQKGLDWLEQAQASDIWKDPNELYKVLPSHDSHRHENPFEVMSPKDPNDAVELPREFYDVVDGQQYLDGILNGTIEVPDSKDSNFI